MGVKRYVKKRVEVEAIQWTGDNYREVSEFIGKMIPYEVIDSSLIIGTLEGDMRASVNDYIIKGIQGEFYPCKPDIFHDTYDEVEEFDPHKTPVGARLDAGLYD